MIVAMKVRTDNLQRPNINTQTSCRFQSRMELELKNERKTHSWRKQFALTNDTFRLCNEWIPRPDIRRWEKGLRRSGGDSCGSGDCDDAKKHKGKATEKHREATRTCKSALASKCSEARDTSLRHWRLSMILKEFAIFLLVLDDVLVPNPRD